MFSIKKSVCETGNCVSMRLKMLFISSLFLLFTCSKGMGQFSRGIGIYPGDLKEDFSPSLIIDNSTYRNLALHRPAYHSGSYDYNLTAQLITDGIKSSELPGWIVVSTSQNGILKKNEREWLIDHNPVTDIRLDSSYCWIMLEMGGSNPGTEIDRVSISGNLLLNLDRPKGWSVKITGSDDGFKWDELGSLKGSNFPGDTLTGFMRNFAPKNLRTFNFSAILSSPVKKKFYKLEFISSCVSGWRIGGFDFFRNNNLMEIAPSHNFNSCWMSEGKPEEWVYVDLGASCTFDEINLYWINSSQNCKVQLSDDAAIWKDVQELKADTKTSATLTFKTALKGRYVRLLLVEQVSGKYHFLSELEVFGRGGPVPKAKPMSGIDQNGAKLNLDGGSWRLQRASLVNENGEKLSVSRFNDDGWLVATVPATVLMSYKNAGAIADPNYSDNQFMISDSWFNSDFWYRTIFNVPASFLHERTFLNFDGINWKAEIFLNGENIGKIEGAFIRGKFDVTDKIIPGKENVIAVHIIKNASYGTIKEATISNTDKNGGFLGADNPTYHASIGWDWIPTIRGRNIGIWNDVYLSSNGPVTINDPFVSTDLHLPDTSKADISLEVKLKNHLNKLVEGILKGTFGDLPFEQPVKLQRLEEKIVRLDPSTSKTLLLNNPRLWWPAGYGAQNLYDVKLTFETSDKKISDSKEFKTGVRKMSYSEAGGKLKIWINGRRFIGRGGNWGFPESNLAYRNREYDIAVRYHKEMNFTMIRNWVGQTADDEFFEACDRYGVMIWQDFWLANPADGPDPSDPGMFLKNADDFVHRIRNHPSIALYCGRNEGEPPPVIEKGLRELLPKVHPGIHYISNSAFGVVSGGGPYRSLPVKTYYGGRGTFKFHSEMGMPNIVSYESLREMMPDSSLWPINRMWGVHDFTLDGAQGGSSFMQQVNANFGEVKTAENWVSLAQWINHRGYRTMFEASGKRRMGLLLWMSHPAWPCLVWQTYDYYFEPTAAYFGCKKANEPLHIQWNPVTDSIELVNYSGGSGTGLTASAKLYNLEGTVIWEKKLSLDCPEDSTLNAFKMEYPDNLPDVQFIKLQLLKGSVLISDNFYWRGLDKNDIKLADRGRYRGLIENNFQALNTLPKVNIQSSTNVEQKGSKWFLTTRLKNSSDRPVLMIRLKVVRTKTGDRILPVIYSDNYISLMPAEERVIQIELDNADTRGEKPQVVISGFNLK
jgi:hypothetical protein